MHHRRHGNSNEAASSLPLHYNEKNGGGRQRFRSCRCFGVCQMWLGQAVQSLSVPVRIVLAVSFVVVGWFLTKFLLYWIPRIEEPFEKYPYWRALIFNPLRYIHAKYVDTNRPRTIRQFVMTPERAFFVNMDRSADRKAHFLRMNGDEDGKAIVQRYSAHEWVKLGGEDRTGGDAKNYAKGQLQRDWEDRYPFLKISSRNKRYGDAGCSLSHLLLWQEKMIDAEQDYLFVFEDDARLLKPLRAPRKSGPKNNNINVAFPTIQAPDVADIVFLVGGTVMKRVDVPWQASPEEPAVRVIGGYGAMGYIITREGAIKMIEWLKTSRKPLDVSFFAASSMNVYLPVSSQWPAVLHYNPRDSARLRLNEK